MSCDEENLCQELWREQEREGVCREEFLRAGKEQRHVTDTPSKSLP
jgi:hypothetical protein